MFDFNRIPNKRLTVCITLLFGICLFAYFSILKDYDIFRSVFVKLWFCFNFGTALIICTVDILSETKWENRFTKGCYQILMFILCVISFILSIILLFSLLPDREGNLWLNVLDVFTTLPHMLQEFSNIFIHILLIYCSVRDVDLNLLLLSARLRSVFFMFCLAFNIVAMIVMQFTNESLQLVFSEIFMAYILIERCTLFLLSGFEFECNVKSKLVRRAQSISVLTVKNMAAVRFVAGLLFSIKNELRRFTDVNEEVDELRKRLHGYYNREFSTFVPAIVGIMILSLFHDSYLKAQIDRGRFKKHHIHVIEMTLDRLAEENIDNHED